MFHSRTRKLVILLVIVTPVAALRFLNQKVISQSGVPRYEAVMYVSYQFNTLKQPTGLLLLRRNGGGDNDFLLFIADSGNHVIRQFWNSIGVLEVAAGTLGQAGYADGYPLSAKFNYPTGITGTNRFWYDCPPDSRFRSDCIVRNYQYLYISDSQNYVVRKVEIGDLPNEEEPGVITVCGTHNTKGFVNGSSMSSCFASLAGVQSVGGQYYIADAENHAIRVWDGANVTTFAGGTAGFEDGYRTSAMFLIPGKTAMDSAGNMYVADIGNNAVRKIDGSGYVSTCAGGGPEAASHIDAQGSGASFSRPTSVVFNASDNMIYVADSHNNCIRKIDSSGNVTTYAGTGEAGLVNGSLASAQFNMPTDIVIYGAYMYVSDTLNNVIRRIDMINGQVSTYIS